MFDSGTLVRRKATQVQLIDDHLALWPLEWTRVPPVEELKRDPASKRKDVGVVGCLLPNISSADLHRIRVEEDFLFVEVMPLSRVVRPVETIAIFNLLVVQVEDGHRPQISQSVFWRKRNLRKREGSSFFKKHERARGRVSRENREVYSAGHMASTEWQRMPVTEAELPVRVSMIEQLRHNWAPSQSKNCAQTVAVEVENR